MAKPCPECRSHNTRQMDKDTFGDYAYCLKCYHKFKSYPKVVAPKQAKNSLKIMTTKEARIEMLRKKLESLESEVEASKKQGFTGAR